jgi:hypothetical protein
LFINISIYINKKKKYYDYYVFILEQKRDKFLFIKIENIVNLNIFTKQEVNFYILKLADSYAGFLLSKKKKLDKLFSLRKKTNNLFLNLYINF